MNLEIDANKPVSVLHPVLVLESRCINLQRLTEKRHGNGITQARVACTVVEHHLAECLNTPARRREAFKATRRIADLARTSAGVFVWKQWGIDVIAAVDASKMPGQFNRSWAHELAEVARKTKIARKYLFTEIFPWLPPDAALKQFAVLPNPTAARTRIGGGTIIGVDKLVSEIRRKSSHAASWPKTPYPKDFRCCGPCSCRMWGIVGRCSTSQDTEATARFRIFGNGSCVTPEGTS